MFKILSTIVNFDSYKIFIILIKSDSTNHKAPRDRSNTNVLLVKGKHTPLSQSPNPSAYSSSSGISANKMYDSGSGDILSSTNDWDTRVKNFMPR